jgi:hypothetical protein
MFGPRPAGTIAAAGSPVVIPGRRFSVGPVPGPFLDPGLAGFRPRRGMPGCSIRLVKAMRRIEIRTRVRDNLLAELCSQFSGFDFLYFAISEIAQFKRSKRHSDQPVYSQPKCFENLTNLAVLAFADAESEPDIGALFAIERCFNGAVANAIDGEAFSQPVKRLLAHAPERTHAITAKPASYR